VVTSPVETLQCRWSPCSPTTVLQGTWAGFSAAGFFFGRELYQQVRVPIGLIHSSWGGTIAEAWTSSEGLKPLGDFDGGIEAVGQQGTEKENDFAAEYETWAEHNDPGTQQGWFKQECDTSNWKTGTMPQSFEQAGLPDFDGIVWFRRTIELPANWAGQKL